MSIFGNRTMKVIESVLDVTSARHTLISSNIANVNTPGYKARDIDFNAALNAAMSDRKPIVGRMTRPGHLLIRSGSSSPLDLAYTTSPQGSVMRNDGNSVDIDIEMAKIAENASMYSTYAQLMASKFSMLKYVISEGRR